MHWIAAVGLAVLAVGGARVYRAWLRGKLRTVTEREFVHLYGCRYSGEQSKVLAERRRVASELGVPVEKLYPALTFEQLARHFRHLGDCQIGWEFLDQEAESRGKEVGVEVPEQGFRTIGEYIQFMVFTGDK